MFLVTTPSTLGSRAVLAALLLGVACQRAEEKSRDGGASALPATSASGGTAGSTSFGSDAAARALPKASPPNGATGSAPPSDAAASPLDAYPAAGKALGVPCSDPRVVLAIRKEYDRSGRVWVQQALLAHPEFKLVDERAAHPFEVDVYETIYGPKRFSRAYVGQPRFSEAVVARCGDATTCERLGAMFHAVSPADATELVCGEPPATTGGFARVHELAPAAMRASLEQPSPVAACARAHACAAREHDTRASALKCSEHDASAVQGCARAATCSEVSACAARLAG